MNKLEELKKQLNSMLQEYEILEERAETEQEQDHVDRLWGKISLAIRDIKKIEDERKNNGK